jgi:hypothetical protein
MSGLLERLFPPPAPAPVPGVVDDQFTIALPSRIVGGYFQAEFSARWVTDSSSPATNREWLRSILTGEARVCTERASVAVVEVTEAAANARLRAIAWPARGNVHNMAVTVRLTASAEARQIATEWEKLQAQLTLSRVKAELEVERLRHLRENIFTKPDVARTYWLDRHPEGLDGVLDNRFERIAEKLGSGPGPSTMTVANLVRDFLSELDPQQKNVLLDLLDRAFTAFGRSELSEQLPLDLG